MGCKKLSYNQEVTQIGKNHFFLGKPYEKNNASSKKRTSYYPFGGVLSHWESNNNDHYRFGYQGEYSEKDEETGFDFFELRAFDSKIGRWMIPDPYGQYWSSYLGMGNNPISRVDPDGGDDINGDGKDDGILLGDLTVEASSLVWLQNLIDAIPEFDFNDLDFKIPKILNFPQLWITSENGPGPDEQFLPEADPNRKIILLDYEELNEDLLGPLGIRNNQKKFSPKNTPPSKEAIKRAADYPFDTGGSGLYPGGSGPLDTNPDSLIERREYRGEYVKIDTFRIK